MYTLRTHPIEYLFADRIAHMRVHTHTHILSYTVMEVQVHTLLTPYSVHTCSVASNSFVTPWTVACKVPLSMGFSTQEYWVAISFSRDLPNAGIKPASPTSALLGGFFTTAPPGKPLIRVHFILMEQFYR